MGHNVGDAAARAVKNSERKAAEAKTPEQRISEIRRNLSSVPVLFNTPAEQRFLLEQYDLYVQKRNWLDEAVKASTATITLLQEDNAKLKEENDQFRAVYELENSSRGTVTVIAENPVTGLPVAAVTQVDFIPAQTE